MPKPSFARALNEAAPSPVRNRGPRRGQKLLRPTAARHRRLVDSFAPAHVALRVPQERDLSRALPALRYFSTASIRTSTILSFRREFIQCTSSFIVRLPRDFPTRFITRSRKMRRSSTAFSIAAVIHEKSPPICSPTSDLSPPGWSLRFGRHGDPSPLRSGSSLVAVATLRLRPTQVSNSSFRLRIPSSRPLVTP